MCMLQVLLKRRCIDFETFKEVCKRVMGSSNGAHDLLAEQL